MRTIDSGRVLWRWRHGLVRHQHHPDRSKERRTYCYPCLGPRTNRSVNTHSARFTWSDTSQPDYCPSLDACKAYTGGVGFNVPMQIAPSAPDGNRCRVLTCMADGCGDAYQYPKDDTKTHTCPLNTNFVVTFCPGGSGGATQAPPQTQAPTPPPTTQAPTPPPTTKAPPTPPPTTQAPTPEPTTAAPTPAPTPDTVANEASSSSSSLLRKSSSAGEDRSIADDVETIAPAATDSAGAAAVTAAAPATVAPDAGTATIGEASGNVKETTTKAEGASGGNGGMVIVAILGAVAMVAGTAIVAVRRKKAQLDALDDKTPAANDRRMMMTTPSGSCIL